MNQSLLIILAFALVFVALWMAAKLLRKNIEEQYQSNSSIFGLDGKHPKFLTRVNGCGCAMLGDFRQAWIGDAITLCPLFLLLFFII